MGDDFTDGLSVIGRIDQLKDDVCKSHNETIQGLDNAAKDRQFLYVALNISSRREELLIRAALLIDKIGQIPALKLTRRNKLIPKDCPESQFIWTNGTDCFCPRRVDDSRPDCGKGCHAHYNVGEYTKLKNKPKTTEVPTAILTKLKELAKIVQNAHGIENIESLVADDAKYVHEINGIIEGIKL